MPSSKPNTESGAALITALVIVAVMSAAILGVIDTMRFSFRVSANIAQRDQAQLMLVGAEKFAIATIKDIIDKNPVGTDGIPLLDARTLQPITMPIEGGAINADLIDGANCFNLNSVVKAEDAGLVVNEENATRFEYLLELIGIGPPQSSELKNSLVDWMDTNSNPGYGGAEDQFYTALDRPYRTSETLLADISELKTISGFNQGVYNALRPFICAYPEMKLQAVNINTLQEWQLVILQSYIGQETDNTALQNLILDRPVGGYRNIETVYNNSVWGRAGISDELKPLFSLRSSYYMISANIQYYEIMLDLTSTVQIPDSGQPVIQSRRFGAS